VLTQQLGDLMSELVALEEEAILVEGRLLEEAGEHPPATLPFNYSSYVARFPLAAALHLTHQVGACGGAGGCSSCWCWCCCRRAWPHNQPVTASAPACANSIPCFNAHHSIVIWSQC
jgi:hypothetical protein